MTGPVRPPDRRWYERSVIAAMVIVGFAIGSLGLTLLSELLGQDPVLTDEFNAPVAEDESETVVAVAVTTTTPPTTSTTAPPTTTPPPSSDEPGEDRSSRRDDAEGDHAGRSDGSARDDDRDARRRA